jgi:hypothetical protein
MIGDTRWTTSIFPDSARDVYVLPIKREVRRVEGLDPGDIATVTVEPIDCLRGRFGSYEPPVLEALGLAEVEHGTRNNRMRAL